MASSYAGINYTSIIFLLKADSCRTRYTYSFVIH